MKKVPVYGVYRQKRGLSRPPANRCQYKAIYALRDASVCAFANLEKLGIR